MRLVFKLSSAVVLAARLPVPSFAANTALATASKVGFTEAVTLFPCPMLPMNLLNLFPCA
jgi:hypothetical protein